MAPPEPWAFRSLHYGYAETHPCFCYWWVVWPDGRMHIAGELRQFHQTIAALCAEIREQSRYLRLTDKIRYTVGALENIGTPKKAGKGRAETFGANGMYLRVIEIDPVQTWTRIHELFGLRPDTRPWVTIDPSCEHLIRALTQAIRDEDDPEHIADFPNIHPLKALGVGAMSRPEPNPFQKPPLPKDAIGHLVNELRAVARAERGQRWR